MKIGFGTAIGSLGLVRQKIGSAETQWNLERVASVAGGLAAWRFAMHAANAGFPPVAISPDQQRNRGVAMPFGLAAGQVLTALSDPRFDDGVVQRPEKSGHTGLLGSRVPWPEN